MKKVLLVDDELKILESIYLWFREYFSDHAMVTAFSLAEAETILKKNKVDLVICDYDLGIEKGTKIFTLDTKLSCPVMFLTGRGSKDVMKELANKNVFSVFEKGVDLSLLEIGILDALKSREEYLKKDKLNFIGQNSANLIHEINNPLTIILGKIELLKVTLEKKVPNYPEETSLIKSIQSIEDASNRLVNLMRRTKDAINGNRNYNIQSICFKTFIDQFIEDNSHIINRENLNLEVNIPENFNIMMDPLSFSQIFANLLSNSADAFDENGVVDRKITISTESMGSFRNIVFEDNGPGIPKESREKVFEKLYTTKTGANGTGLGLYICREIVQHHMGELFLDKNSNSARFIMKLPVK